MVPLTMAGNGGMNRIVKITGRDEVRRRLAELGFVVGTDVTVTGEMAGNVIVAVRSSRVALDRTMANRILVDA